ncbi:ethanolamine ammonia-lyase subunit EutC [Leptospira sp. GIMC2001]|uniref:ethanolamine ammonia-lyase subunit EutC n=1 Tax=Leptospira sp. GIMC2001 TaxID=1513297 RepID=UPI002349EEA2|nr:ethanolamine ammonia-lyase subunit EutC [Leptospira sp. GIMC2001]WCL50379.1 ethanolamine ammonia-lyase subunit EutC [Leptospira sp. GIMC2001]
MASNHQDPWRKLRTYTDARIGLGRTGQSERTDDNLAFRLAHAKARDSLKMNIDPNELQKTIQERLGVNLTILNSQADNLETYLCRPDKGRLLSEESINTLENLKKQNQNYGRKFIAITNGLSSLAIINNIHDFLSELSKFILELGFQIGVDINLIYIHRSRVAITDHIGSILNSELGILLVGERPGLSSPDSLGAYLTFEPRLGKTDESRNCISNIRPKGLPYSIASKRLVLLIQESLNRKISGVQLKDNSESISLMLDTKKVQVKICGVRTSEIAVYAVSEDADYIGINLSQSSKRNVKFEIAQEISKNIHLANARLSKDCKVVLLFFKNPIEEILKISRTIRPDFIQLIWGDEELNSKWDFLREEFNLLPAFSVSEQITDLDLPFPNEEICILDSPSNGQGGGTGAKFPWDRLSGLTRKYLLAGGLNPENVEQAVRSLHPYGVDVASGVESSPGVQSREKIREFIQNAKK